MSAATWGPKLLDWYRRNRRDLPWRRTRDPYAVWVSEVMLQQTQVATALPYYERWMARFPDVLTLAQADDQTVLAHWQGLGYYRRARYLLEGARWVATQGWPTTLEEWRKVPGVGEYTAAAVGSIAQDMPAAVVDGNVERVFARFTACDQAGTALLKEARAWARDVLDRASPGDWNQALMELGATVCTPRRPRCAECPIEAACVARQNWSVERYPSPSAKPAPVAKTHTVWAPYGEGRFGVRQIPEGEWWGGMWEFPRVESTEPVARLREIVGEGWLEDLGTVRHHVTHHRITIDAWLVRVESRKPGLSWRTPSELKEIPMPSPQRKVLERAFEALGLPRADRTKDR